MNWIAKLIGHRWAVCGLLFFATTINYIDRQILSLLKPILDDQLHWTNAEFGTILTTGIPDYLCREINLVYRDPKTILKEELAHREKEGVLLVPKTGDNLYCLENEHFS